MSNELVNLLKTFPLFQGLDDAQLSIFVRNAVDMRYGRGDIIFTEGDERKAFSVVVSGRVKMFKSSPEGKEQTLYVFGEGESFCVCAAFQGRALPASAAALEPSRVLLLDRAALQSVATEEPLLLFNMLRILSQRLKQTMDLVESLSLKELPQRIATFLIHAEGQSDMVTLPMSHREFAKMLGATPEALSRSFKRMAEQGVVAVNGRDIAVLDSQGLEECAQFGMS